MAEQQDDIKTLAEQIRGIRVAMLTTEGNDGVLRSRPMMTQDADFDGVLWFFTDEGAGKVSDLYHHREVNITYVDPTSNRYVSVSGTAQIVRDREKAQSLWGAALKAWFPKGLDDPRVVLMMVTVSEAEYWSAPKNATEKLASFAEALHTGKRPQVGEHGEIDVRPID